VDGATESVSRILEALDNQPGPARDIVILNAGTALYASGVARDIADGVGRAREAIASGKARAKLDQFVRFTRQCA
jgi:anthranilate phosphoribosyltransferase